MVFVNLVCSYNHFTIFPGRGKMAGTIGLDYGQYYPKYVVVVYQFYLISDICNANGCE